MKGRNNSHEDPVVAEVRRTRAALFKRAGGTLQGFFALARKEAAAAKLTARRKPARRAKGARSRARR
jgi:hypothetical protein